MAAHKADGYAPVEVPKRGALFVLLFLPTAVFAVVGLRWLPASVFAFLMLIAAVAALSFRAAKD